MGWLLLGGPGNGAVRGCASGTLSLFRAFQAVASFDCCDAESSPLALIQLCHYVVLVRASVSSEI